MSSAGMLAMSGVSMASKTTQQAGYTKEPGLLITVWCGPLLFTFFFQRKGFKGKGYGTNLRPGQTAFTRIPNGPYSCAAVDISPRTANFDAAYADRPAQPTFGDESALLLLGSAASLCSSSFPKPHFSSSSSGGWTYHLSRFES